MLPSDHIEESLEEAVKFWFKSQTDVTAPIINSYSVILCFLQYLWTVDGC